LHITVFIFLTFPVIPLNFKNISQKTAFKLDEELENAIDGVWHLLISDTIIVRGICGQTLSTINSIKKGSKLHEE